MKISKVCKSQSGLNQTWKVSSQCLKLCSEAEKKGEIRALPRAFDICGTLLRSKEAGSFGRNGKACGKASCIYKLNPIRITGPGLQGSYGGNGVKLSLSNSGGGLSAKANIGATKLTFFMDCAPSGCGDFRQKSGPSGKLEQIDNGLVLTIRR